MLMSSTAVAATSSKGMLWTGRVISTLVVLFMLFDCITKIVKEPHTVAAVLQVGFPESAIIVIGLSLLLGVILYVIPHTSVLGAILIASYLGGAVCTNVRIQAPLWHSGFAIAFAVLAWLGLWLREPRLRALVPFRS
jgi:DoxX-like family